MSYVIVVLDDGGYKTHTGDTDIFDLPDSAEIYDDREKFEDRLDELSGA